jgi:hypothetical protein
VKYSNALEPYLAGAPGRLSSGTDGMLGRKAIGIFLSPKKSQTMPPCSSQSQTSSCGTIPASVSSRGSPVAAEYVTASVVLHTTLGVEGNFFANDQCIHGASGVVNE